MHAPSRFWWSWLVVLTCGLILFGLTLVLLPGPTQAFCYWLLFGTAVPPPTFGADAVAYVRFVYGILGAVIAAWGLLLLAVVAGPLRPGERTGWLAVYASIAVWFVIDSTLSIVSDQWLNVVPNVAFLVPYVAPLVATRLGHRRGR
jgi:uncharacterized membrane protein YhaH (DUF805 family)